MAGEQQKSLDWDADDDSSVDREDAVLVQRQAAYYARLAEQGQGFFDENLAHIHDAIDLAAEKVYYTEPKSLSLIERDIRMTPDQHPLRAIACVLNNAPNHSIVRVSAYRLTDLAAIDLLVHAGARTEVRVILHPCNANQDGLTEFISSFGKVGQAALLEHVEIRLANTTDTSCESSKQSMHMKSIITDTHTTFGSYNLSAFARVANWEELCVVETTDTAATARFDAHWEKLARRAAENHYVCLQNVPPGPRRRARIQHRNAVVRRQDQEQAAAQTSQNEAKTRVIS